MPLSNFERMIQLAEDVFASRSDPNQLDVDKQIIERLQHIHPSTVSELDDGDGPVAWVLVIPTTIEIMKQFLGQEITEKELLDLTPLDVPYEALYICSALVLEEYRRRGIAKRLAIKAIENIRKDHPLKALFVWAFTKEGNALAENVAGAVSLSLEKRVELN